MPWTRWAPCSNKVATNRQAGCRQRSHGCRQTLEIQGPETAFRLVELRGLEPLTPTLPVWCATSCAIAPISCALQSPWSELEVSGHRQGSGVAVFAVAPALSRSRFGCGRPAETCVTDVAQQPPSADGLVNHFPGDVLHLGQVLGPFERFRVDLVDVLGARRPRGKPCVGGRHLQSAQ